MAYGNFKSVSQVARQFNLTVADQVFITRKPIAIPELYFMELNKRLSSSIYFINETTICESIIRPILDIVAAEYEVLQIWSHVPYSVDVDKGLVGEPDYLIAPRSRYGDMETPALCVIEAKQEKFDEGWTQALAEMVASSLSGAELCYSAVTTGKAWEFGRLQADIFTRHPVQFSAATDLQQVFELLNWLFHQSSLFYAKNN